MGGKRQLQQHNYSDPFNAGQMVGMLVMLTFIERNNGIPEEMLLQMKSACAMNAETYLQKPIEDIFLMIDKMVGDIENQ